MMWLEFLFDRIGGPEVFQAVFDGKKDAWSNPAAIDALTKVQDLVKANGFIKGFSSITADSNADQALLYTGKAAMMLHGAWTYGNMKTDGGDFVTGGHLGYMNFPPVDGGKGDPSDTVGNPGQYLSISSKATDAQKETAKKFFATGGARRRRGQGRGSTPASVPIVKGADAKLGRVRRTPTSSSSSTTSPARPRVFAQSWDQALSPTAAETLLDNIAKLFQLSITPAAVRRQHERGHRAMTALAPPGVRSRVAAHGRGRRAAARRCRVDGAAGAGRLRRLRRRPAARRAGCSASPRGTASAPSTPSGLTSWTAVLTDPGLPHALWVTFLIMVLSWLVQTPMSILLGVFLAGPPALPRVPRGALLHPAAAELGGDRDHLQGAARPQLRPRRRAAHRRSCTQDWLGEPNARPRRRRLRRVLAVHPVPLADLPGRGAADPDARCTRRPQLDGAGRVRQFFSITLPQLKYTIITSSTLMVVGSLTFFDLIFVLTAGGPADATRILALDMYKTGLPGQPDGPGQRDRRDPRPRRPRAGAAAAPARRRRRDDSQLEGA